MPSFVSPKLTFLQKFVQTLVLVSARGLSRKLLVREYGNGRKDLAALLRATPNVEYFSEERAHRRLELVLLDGKNHVPTSTSPPQMDLVIAVDAAREIPAEKLGEWISGIVDSLAPSGSFVLFANKLISRSVYVPESGYLHAVHRALPRDCSLTVTTTTDAAYDVYQFSRNKKRTLLLQRMGRRAEPTDIATLDARGEAMLVRWVERTTRRLENGCRRRRSAHHQAPSRTRRRTPRATAN